MRTPEKTINLANEQKICNRSAKFFDCKGLIYKFMGDLDAALEMHEKALLLSREINDKHGIRQYLNNKGLIFEERAKFEEAMLDFDAVINIIPREWLDGLKDADGEIDRIRVLLNDFVNENRERKRKTIL